MVCPCAGSDCKCHGNCCYGEGRFDCETCESLRLLGMSTNMNSYDKVFGGQGTEAPEELQFMIDSFSEIGRSSYKTDCSFTVEECNATEDTYQRFLADDISFPISSFSLQSFDLTPFSRCLSSNLNNESVADFNNEPSESTLSCNGDDQVTENYASTAVKGSLPSFREAFPRAAGALLPWWETSSPYVNKKQSPSSVGETENPVFSVLDKGGMVFNSSNVFNRITINLQDDTNLPITQSSDTDLNHEPAVFIQHLMETSSHSGEYKCVKSDSSPQGLLLSSKLCSSNLGNTLCNGYQYQESGCEIANYSTFDLQDNTDLSRQSPISYLRKKHENREKTESVIMTKSSSTDDRCIILSLRANFPEALRSPFSFPFSKPIDFPHTMKRSKEVEKYATSGSDEDKNLIFKFSNSHDLPKYISGSGERTQCDVKLNCSVGKIFSCTVCDRNFKRKQGLKEHKQKCSGKIPVECKLCNEKFHRSVYLVKHSLMHGRNGLFVCNVCYVTFFSSGELDNHWNEFHRDVKKLVCSICNKRFQYLSKLKRHHLIHTGEKPFECENCGKKFARKGNLNKHLKTHSKREKNKHIFRC